jgi:hypothetical protein
MAIWKIHTDKNRLISLKDRKDRFDKAKKELESVGIDYELMVWLNWKKLWLFFTKWNTSRYESNHWYGNVVEIDMIPTTRCPFPKSKMAWMVWCFLSHFLCIQDAYMKWYERIAIFEDDVVFSNDFIERIEKEINDVPENWEILFLWRNNQRWNSPTYYNKNVVIPNDVRWMHWYMVQGKWIKKLYDLLCEWQTDHIDVMINRKFSKELEIYAFSDPLCIQWQSQSNIA